MVTIERCELSGNPGWELANDSLRVFIPGNFGPRVLGLRFEDGPNLLAVLPQARINVEGQPPFSLRGGHRLWAAPEQPAMTYAADDTPIEITRQEEGLDIRQEVDRAGIQKSWQVRLEPQAAEVAIRHELTNAGQEPVELAPWAVTMLQPGGVGLLPLLAGNGQGHSLSPNRQLVVWPYTDLESPCLQITNLGVFVKAQLTDGMLKVGAPNPSGWIAYSRERTLFVKRTVYQEGAAYPDRSASHQIYCDPGAIELETLGPLVRLGPGESAAHQETWQLFKEGSWPEEILDSFGEYQSNRETD